MKCNGYRLREAIRRHQLRRDAAVSRFNDSLHVFPGETKASPQQLVESISLAEDAIARLQTMQANYNVTICVTAGEYATQSIALCVKLVGGIERVEKMWRKAASEKKESKFYLREGDPLVRKADQVAAARTITHEQALRLAEAAARTLGKLREAIATANAMELEFPDSTATLFE